MELTTSQTLVDTAMSLGAVCAMRIARDVEGDHWFVEVTTVGLSTSARFGVLTASVALSEAVR